MEKEFIPHEQALALKELGFDEFCFGRYLIITDWEIPTGEIRLQLGAKIEDYDKNQFIAPLYQQAFRWFREKYKLFGYVMDTEDGNYYWGISKSFSGETEEDSSEGPYDDTYEEAELECLKKLIEIVKNK